MSSGGGPDPLDPPLSTPLLSFTIVTLFRSCHCSIVSYYFRYLPFDFSSIKLFKACSASFKTSCGKTLSVKLTLQNVYLYKQPNVTMTPEYIMQTRFPSRKNSVFKKVANGSRSWFL
jgi:hypothetical protein